MDTQLIAKILPTKKDGKRSIGTGYPISHELVLTARHVVLFDDRDDKKPINVEWPDLTNNADQPYTDENTEVIYENEEYDIALLKCKVPPQGHFSPLLLSQRFPAPHEPWETFGYPQLGKDEAGTREKVPALGKFHPPDANSHKISLSSESDAIEKTGWCGISGAPVFQGTTLYAVIIETPTTREACFTAVSIPFLLKKSPDFREKVDFDPLKQNFNDAIGYMQKRHLAKDALLTQITQDHNQIANSPEAIIRYLATLPIPGLIATIRKTQKQVSSPSVRQQLGQLVMYLLPSLYGFGCVSQVSASQDTPARIIEIPIEIPYATDVSAEILMAASDKREADFRMIELEYGMQIRPGKYCLALPPESGPDNGDQQLQDIGDDLHKRLARGDDLSSLQFAVDEHLFKINPRKQQRHRTPEVKKKLVQAWLEDNATAGRPSFYWLLNLSGNQEDDTQIHALAESLKSSYSHITLLSLDIDLSGDREIHECRLFNQLADTQATD